MNQKAPAQLIFDLPVHSALEEGDFLISPSNQAAVDLISSWPRWSQPCALLMGPAASGKSHLAAVWLAASGGKTISALDLTEQRLALFADDAAPPAWVVEDIDRGIGDERVLFHLINHARETGRHVLMTSRRPPGEIEIALPDLRSRVRALAPVAIEAPDDALLGAVLVKLFCDRQLTVEPSVISYLVRHMDRSMDSARSLVMAIDALALARQSKVTRATAADAIAAANDDGASNIATPKR